MNTIISVENLCKKFTNRVRSPGIAGSIKSLFTARKEEIAAVDNINFSVKEGELIGYLGPNGAGKSTTIKMLTGILRPTSGRVLINGIDPAQDRRKVTKNIGVVFGQKTQLWWDLPVGESFNLLKAIYKIDNTDFKRRMELFNDLLHIGDFIQQQTRKLSLGQRMRADLAASLLHDPPVLFLDEPTIGLDILTRDTVRDFISKLNTTQKTTILLTTHDIVDIEMLATRLILLDRGKIQYDGNIEDFIGEYALTKILSLHLEAPRDTSWFQNAGYEVIQAEAGKHFEIKLKQEQSLAPLIDALSADGGRIAEIEVRKQDLGETLKQVYSGSRNVEL